MNATWFTDALARYPRIAIAGGPRVGKTTLCQFVNDRPIIHTDDWIDRDWEDVPFIALEACKGKPRFVLEGVQVPRTLRKGLEVDAVVWMNVPVVPRTPKQESMAKAVLSVYAQWRLTHQDVPAIFPPPSWASHTFKRNFASDQ